MTIASARLSRTSLCVGIAAFVASVPLTSAEAGFSGVHPTTLRVVVDGFDSGEFLLDGVDLGNGDYQYVEDDFTGGEGDWNMEWDLLASPSFDPDASLQGGFVVRNTGDSDLSFDILLTTPLLGGSDGGDYFGSAALTIENGVLSSDGALWQGLIDGATTAELFTGDYVLDGTETTNDDNDFTMGGYGSAAETIGVRLTFDLTAGGDMTTTFGWGITSTPAPSALALLGLGAMFGRRRRH